MVFASIDVNATCVVMCVSSDGGENNVLPVLSCGIGDVIFRTPIRLKEHNLAKHQEEIQVKKLNFQSFEVFVNVDNARIPLIVERGGNYSSNILVFRSRVALGPWLGGSNTSMSLLIL